MSDIYSERSYGEREIGFAGKPGIVVVDFQRAFTDPAMPMGGAELIERGVQNTARLLEAARRSGVPVANCYVAFNNEREMPRWKVGAVADLKIGTPETELDPRIVDPAYDVVVRKTGPSIFFGTPVASFMAKEGVESMIVTGCVTSGCVRASIVDSFSHGFRTMVPEDCVGDHDAGPHHANLEDCGRRYADIVMADDCIAYIEDWRKRNG
jgi:maleamate amidohydrolase